MSKVMIEVEEDAVEKLDDFIRCCYRHLNWHKEDKLDMWEHYMDFMVIATKEAKGVAKSFGLYPYNQPIVKEPNPIPKMIREGKGYELLR